MTPALDTKLIGPEDPRWDEARRAWNLAVDQRPAAVALPESADDVAAALALAAERGLRVAPQGTGHRATPLGDLADTLLLKTERLRGVEVDPARGFARVQAGTTSTELADAAGQHGLAALTGSGLDVGFVGYALAGGIGWLGRAHGLAANSVTAAEVVTADGALVRADADHEPELFWALRGGGGSFGVVTALELRLLPIAQAYAGILWWPIERGPDVLHAWRELTAAEPPDELTTVGRYLRLPPVPQVPEHLRGRAFVVVEAFYAGEPAQADELLAPLRALEPEMDTLEVIPSRRLVEVHGDPPEPVPGVSDGFLLSELPAAAIDEVARVAGSPDPSPLVNVEVRHLGGELARARPENGALASIDAEFVVVGVGMAPAPEPAAAAKAQLQALEEAVAPWTAPRASMNFADSGRDPGAFWDEATYARLRRVKAELDPEDRIRANHPVPG